MTQLKITCVIVECYMYISSQSKEAKRQMATENSLRSVGANGVGTETNGRSTRGKDGLNGGANSLRMMGRSDESATQQQSFSTWRRLQKSWSDFKVSRETYSMWWFPPEHRYFDFNSIHLYSGIYLYKIIALRSI